MAGAGAGRLHPSRDAAGCWCLSGGIGRRRLLLLLLSLSLLVGAGAAIQGEDLHACKESEYHYEYTACDSLGSRWRVAVPHNPGLCTGLPDPIRGTECSFSCKAGEFLDMKDQSCKPCLEGTYSLGTGIRFDEWDTLPHGFANIATNLEIDYSFTESLENCTMSKWVPMGDFIASNTDECTATLMYAVNLKQSGSVSFEYIYPDSSIVFEFFVQNDQCQPTVEESRWMKTTEKGWEIHTVELGRGNNVLYWRTTAFSVWSKAPKPVLVRNIGITGVAYTSECFPCKAGTYTAKSGSSFCQQCLANSYSSKGATFCHQCEPTMYSEPGSATCKPRPACTDKDYFYTHSACDTNGETQLMYKWAEPKICREDLSSAVSLPPSGVKMMCPPCNPGFFKTNASSCEPCTYGSYSNGSGCINCPVGTEPVLGFEYKWWNMLPANMETTVLSGISFEYKGMAGWEVAGDYIYTAAGASDDDFMILTLVVPGFSPPQSVTKDSENKEIARITFVFETICSVNCKLYFMVGMNSRTDTPVETWAGPKGKQSYTYIIEKNATMSFTWAFQRTAYHEAGRKYTNNVARLYSVNVTNVIDGVASYCRQCALESSGSSCTSCPAGHYIDRDSGGCYSCLPNTYLKAHQPYGSQACIPCGPGTKNNKIHSLCYNDCHFSVSRIDRTLEFDFSALANTTSFSGDPSFTSKGLKYFHHFNISLCGNHGRKMATCTDNVTDIRILGKEAESSRSATSYVCQSVIVPSDMMGYKTVVSSQPVSLADRLVGVTTESTLDNITSPVDYFPLKNVDLLDVIFFFRSNDVTQTCNNGRATAIRVRCDPLKSPGSLSVPIKCPEGTCDGCTFHFLWETVEGCPLCSTDDYHAITSACVGGIQRTTYVWWEPKLCAGGIPLPEQKVSICETMDFWLKVGISAGTCAAILLTVLTCYFWKKNQKLEYKYSKLVMNSSAKDSELPAADSCAIMEGEDVEDDLIFTSKNSLFGKIKAFTTKASLSYSQAWQESVCRDVLNKLKGGVFQRTSDGFDSVPLKTSSGTTDIDL
ncbi:endosome/lysosome-associated apoptosis and autophagy regulator 1 isoform X1 [Heteronotia binoei]|uniref:endosome/lysosome-associated apoptosis and autophagy regulator 1 isoform X1 n=1 Tax=Heteronotia binoei TaxID=13085 RepID=UPI0029300CA0|nr:endosome/lysosome-associated apoptosis and autophagy regulator 1 isoform X1 [Heteronotia binoei]